MVEQGAAPAGGSKRSLRARAVPGPRPQAIGPAARSSLMVGSGWLCPMLGLIRCSVRGRVTGFFGKANSRQKRGPAAGRRRRGAPRGAGILETECSHTEKLERRLARHTLDIRGKKSLSPRRRGGRPACPGPQRIRAMMRVRASLSFPLPALRGEVARPSVSEGGSVRGLC